MSARTAAGLALACVCGWTAGCGSDYEPPRLETTGLPAEPLGQVLDLEIELPHLQIMGARSRGVDLELRFEIEEVGYGRLPGRVVPVGARVDQRSAVLEDLSDGRVDVLVTRDAWTPGQLGPFRVENTVFDLLLSGEPLDTGGWRIAGESWESQTGLRGTFEGWRRHRFLIATGDFFSSTGSVAEAAVVKGRELVVRDRLEPVSSDAVLRVTNRAALAINRFTFDNLQRLDPESDFATAWQAGTGAGSNPHDALLIDADRGYATRYEPPFDDVAVFDARRGTVVGSIPLGSLAENRDGAPRADRMRAAEGVVFVGLQDIDRSFTRYAEGKLAVIDPALDEVVGVIPLGGKNPGTIDAVLGEDGRTRLFVALAGIYPGLLPRELSGGVVVVDAAARALERVALDDDDAGGNVTALAMVSGALGYVVVTDEAFRSSLIAFDPRDGRVLRRVLETDRQLPEIEVDSGGVLAVPERAFDAPRICLYRVPPADAAADATENPIGCVPTALPPFSLEALD